MQSFSVRSLVEHPALRFLVVGGLGFVITMGINYGLKFFVMPQHPVTALAIGITVATVVSYFLNKKWSFGDRGELRTGHELLLFLVVSLIGIGLNSAPLWISRYVFGLEVPNVSLAGQELADFISGPVIGTLIAMGFRYWAMNRFVFPARSAPLDA
ncbi:GtrA family protein [Curtobacterium sp. MCPF17_047]|uniref:GtrA family protein n=1 Tax=unclassified Curtobacterium TaxID=257496 RepID=UPI000DA903ED|nr:MULTISPECIES: GtrA family protein [unclassified Curtobacterium]PZE62707.1 GtrA family protein [Curtobacterium sp. MCPF17_001]PZF65494.1 GtrA family protein [Curtobacterium sp. MCPF17_047]WIB11620.1 GtrA family protein [Curtobacterium sp. MCPF17_052]